MVTCYWRLQASTESPGVTSRHFFYLGVRLDELSVFIDESGGQNGISKYVLMTLIFHDQSAPIASLISEYENSLVLKGLPDIPFHASPLIYGKGAYSNHTHAIAIACSRLFSYLFASFQFRIRRSLTAEAHFPTQTFSQLD